MQCWSLTDDEKLKMSPVVVIRRVNDINNDSFYRTDINDKDALLWRLPFCYNWKRELVIRSVQTNQNQSHSSDVYYIAPNGRKLRSLPEIEKYLQENKTIHGVSKHNFTFLRKLIDVKNSKFETIRNARKKTQTLKLLIK